MVRNRRLSDACKEGTAYRSVIGKIVGFADGIILKLYPDMSRTDRIKMAHNEPFWSASKELRNLTEKEVDDFKKEKGLQ